MIISKRFIPSLFTILNAFCGFYSIVSSSNGDYETAALFIFYASLFDMFDGIVARILKSSSEFGVELDSLSDVISFGVAPSFLLYSLYFKNFEAIGVAIASMMMAFAAIRLARFNVELVGFDKNKFYGVPTPLAALTIATYILFFHNIILPPQESEKAILALSVAIPLLMVSKFQYPVFPKVSIKSLKANKLIFSFLFIVILITIFTKGVASFPICILYILSGVIKSSINFLKNPINTIKRTFS